MFFGLNQKVITENKKGYNVFCPIASFKTYLILCPQKTSDIFIVFNVSSIRETSSSVSKISAAPIFSSSLCSFLVPGIGTIPFAIIHASEICAGVEYFSVARLFSISKSSWLSPLNCGISLL